MAHPASLAIDVALLLPPEPDALARRLNGWICERSPDGFRFDASHLPHITLLQLAVARERLAELHGAVERVQAGFEPLALSAGRVAPGSSSLHLLIEPQPELQRLHEELVHASLPLRVDPTPESFYAPDDEPRDGDLEWVRGFADRSSFEAYLPHVTLGKGPAPELPGPIAFDATRLASCHLGRFCTCRVVLAEWTLGAGGGTR